MRPLFVHSCPETRNRIRVAVAAYAYEIASNPIMSDAEFDGLAASIRLHKVTKRKDMDEWFRANFQPHTGQWIHKHPELQRIGEIYETIQRR